MLRFSIGKDNKKTSKSTCRGYISHFKNYFDNLFTDFLDEYSKKTIYFFFAWLIISLLQAYFTNLTSDEGYYWFYTSHLQWGYYDHPPVTALLIKGGYSIFQNELGVRLFNVLITSFSFLLFFRLIPENLKQKNFTYLILLAQPLLHYFSIIVFPDGPLLFFSLLFLLGYKRLMEKNDLLSALMMGIAMSGMFYSKYYGVLIPAFTLLSNFKLLRSKWFWFSLAIPLMLAIPHVMWQYKNGFPSLQFHLRTGQQDLHGVLSDNIFLSKYRQSVQCF